MRDNKKLGGRLILIIKSKKHRKIFIINLTLVVFSLLLFFVIAESITRFFWDETEYYPEYMLNHIESYQQTNDMYVDATNGLRYSFNKSLSESYKRFVSKSTSNGKNSMKYRVAILGDSFTAGAGVKNLKDNYIPQLVNIVQNKSKNGKKIEILAFGDGGINSHQEYIILKDLIISSKPDLIILQFTANDADPMRDNWGLFIPSKKNILIIDKKIVPALPFMNYKKGIFLLRNFAFLRFISFKLSYLNIKLSSNIEESMFYVQKMYEISKDNNMSFGIINFPPAIEQSNSCDYEINVEIEKLTKKNNITYYNLCDFLNPMEVKSTFEKISGHYNKDGYFIAASVIDGMIQGIS